MNFSERHQFDGWCHHIDASRVCQLIRVNRILRLFERNRLAAILARCSHVVFSRVRVTRCGIETIANPGMIASRRVNSK